MSIRFIDTDQHQALHPLQVMLEEYEFKIRGNHNAMLDMITKINHLEQRIQLLEKGE